MTAVWRWPLYQQITLAIGLAVVAGITLGPWAGFGFVGQLFLNALKMLIVPLIVSSIITGVMGIGTPQALGRLGGKTLFYYATTTTLAVFVGLFFVNVLNPGGFAPPPPEAIDSGFAAKVEGRGLGDIAGIFLRMLPTNIVAAAANGEMLGLITFSLLFGAMVLSLPAALKETQQNFWQGLSDVMVRMTNLVMRFAPVGVFGLVAKVVAETGFSQFAALAVFTATVLLALSTHMFVTMPLLLKFVGGVNPIKHYKAMTPALLTAFSTSSSASALPVTMECVSERAGVSKNTTSFVLPLGATVNMDGTALYECVVVMFVAQLYGVDLSIAQQLSVVLLALLTSVGVAGIPSASLVAISVILTSLGLPLEGVGLILVVDRVLDMCRTAVNVFSDSCGAVIIARREGEQTNLL